MQLKSTACESAAKRITNLDSHELDTRHRRQRAAIHSTRIPDERQLRGTTFRSTEPPELADSRPTPPSSGRDPFCLSRMSALRR